MNISILGLGYVGVVTAACLCAEGHEITGVDINASKVELIGKGISPIVEKDVPEMLAGYVKDGRLKATCDVRHAIASTDFSIICVGTPSRPNNSLDTSHIENVCIEMGKAVQAMQRKAAPHVFVFRSTMLPGTMRNIVIPLLEKHSGMKCDVDFMIAYNPEFLRESTAVSDFRNPPKTVVGADSDKVSDIVMSLYDRIPGPKIKTGIETAEMVKYVDNSFHALKVSFANEVGRLCKSIGIDSHHVMDIFVQDTKLNISKAYLRPGFAFGGSCLPKDVRAMNYLSKTLDLELPVFRSILESNKIHIKAAVDRVISFNKKKIGFAGFSFKENTDDLRESPVLDMIETLIGKGYDVRLYDRCVSLARLMGANKEYLSAHIPHISRLMVGSLDELISFGEVIVVGNREDEFVNLYATMQPDKIIFDLVRAVDTKDNDGTKISGGRKDAGDASASGNRCGYEGICW